MKNRMRKLSLTVILCVLAVCFVSATALIAHAEEPNYYVCFSNQNYAVRNANKMEATEGEYILKNVSLSSAVDFYVTDNKGMRWYAKDNAPMKVEETGPLHYDILFSLETAYENGSYVSYRFYEPAVYSVTVSETETELTYNPYHTAYDLYYISAVELRADTVVAYGEETHAITESGYYRILFTPEKVTDGKTYLFDENGNYGSGDEYRYSVYIEDAPRYYAVFEDGVILDSETAGSEIKGKPAYSLAREESNVTAAEYRSTEVFAPERDFGIKYRVYEKTPDGTFRLIDDDNNADTEVSKLTVSDRGWYVLSFTAGEGNYLSAFRSQEKDFQDRYLAGEFNGFCYDESGNIDLSDEYKFTEIEDGDADYNADYKQYIIYLIVDEQQVKNDPVEFYITNGKTKFKDGTDYIQIKLAGTYKIICSEEHNYGRGRNFRYVLQDEGKESAELLIGSAEEFIAFARECDKSAEYSVNLKVYLTADIDFAGVTFVPVGAFSGTLYGGYHKLKNITYSDGANSACVFERLTHTAAVERLTVENINLGEEKAETVGVIGRNYGKVKEMAVSGKVTGKNLVGGIVAVNGSSETETGDSVETVNSAKIESCVNNAEVNGETFVGGIAGRNTGHVAACENAGAVTGMKTRSSATVAEVGGIAGYSLGKVYDCANRGNVNAGDSGQYVGGIVGLCVGEIYFSVNRGQVTADQYAGGIVGYYGLRQAENSPLDGIVGGSNNNQQDPVNNINILNYNVNFGDVTASAYVGGVVGNAAALSGNAVGTRTLKIFNCASVGKTEAVAGAYAGGIAGNAAGVRIKSCFSSGSVQAKGLNAGKYVGGIVGYGGEITYSMSVATLKGEDYIGGIAGYATSAVKGCYTNAVLLPSDGAVNVGGIAGYSANYDTSKNEFTDVMGNYYVGAMGGIGKTDFGASHKYAATSVPAEVLASVGMLSPVLSEDFSREYWQGGKDVPSYPFLRNFEEVEKCEEFDDEALFAKLFDKNAETLFALSGDSAKLTYTVTFMEWNKDNGDLYKDGELQIDNFDIVTAIRVIEGQSVTVPELTFAASDDSGKYVYAGDNARYFVRFPAVQNVNGNLTVYAQYLEILTSVTDAENRVFAEGQFAEGTEVALTRIGEYATVKFTLDGVEITVENVTVKYFVGDEAENFTVSDSEGKTLDSTVSGKYLSFNFTSGNYFSVKENSAKTLPLWAWILITFCGTAIVVAGGAVLIVLAIKKKKARAKVDANTEVGEDTRVEAMEEIGEEINDKEE